MIVFNADQDLSFLSSNFTGAGLEGIDLHSPPGGFRSIRLYSIAFQYAPLSSAIAHAITNPGDGIYDSGISGMNSMRIGIAQMADAHGDQHLFMRPTVIGDLNLDGSVSIADFIELAAHFNQTSARWQDGDVNYDNTVSVADFLELAANFNTNYSGEIFPIDPAEQQLLSDFYSANVPEPSAILLLALAAAIASLRPKMIK
jgi:hypothetical protein